MASINKVILIGNLGRDPEIRYATEGGMQIASFSLATTRTYKNQAGQRVDDTEWHRVVAFGRTAEICGNYLKKGSSVYVEGRLKTRKWEKDGQTHYATEIIVENLQMLGARADASRGQGAPVDEFGTPANSGFESAPQMRTAAPRQTQSCGAPQQQYGAPQQYSAPASVTNDSFGGDGDDIPF